MQMIMPQPKSTKKDASSLSIKTLVLIICSFFMGCLLTASVVLLVQISDESPKMALHPGLDHHPMPQQRHVEVLSSGEQAEQHQSADSSEFSYLLGLNVLVVIASFDFSQIPHLEEVLDAYHDLAVAGAKVDVVIHTTVAYPVTLIDLWNTRFVHSAFSLAIALKPPSLRLHLVDCHRSLFYERLEQYDLFIYTEDDILVTPSTVSAYLAETARVNLLVQGSSFRFHDFNVGIIRYEYNYPPNVVIDDKTRHATMNVTRVYWEHSGYKRPVVPNGIDQVEQKPLAAEYVGMKNHHQGMFLATRELLRAWKDRGPKCDFANARNRPGRGNQPTEGTQRVWMSSHMLYGKKHCGVQQVLPKFRFPSLTVLHLPNKNYRRVGKYRNRTFSDGTEVFQQPHESLLTAMEVHLALRKAFPPTPQQPYRGIRMLDEVDKARDRTSLLERRLKEYGNYAKRGGVLSDYDFTKTELIEEE